MFKLKFEIWAYTYNLKTRIKQGFQFLRGPLTSQISKIKEIVIE